MTQVKTVLDKLKIENYKNRLFLNVPDTVMELQGVSADYKVQQTQYDCIFFFVFSLEEFEKAIDAIVEQKLLVEGGYLYLVYPKKGNKDYDTFIHRDSIMTLPMDENGYFKESLLKFSRMVAFNNTFTVCGLRHLKKVSKKSTKPSQCVDDYKDKVTDLKVYFQNQPEILERYVALTPGYQRDWARYIYSARTQNTIDKRLIEMAEILKQGFKTKQLYTKSKQ
ncbi:MAG: YdeI/OmpD-associated family protein [Niameybacter sp.]|nr:YdeI/OmpD-associated family protein [Niameybacter sp.]